MIIEHFNGREKCISNSELYKILEFKTKKGVNEFWISQESGYPALVLLVNNELAYIHFFQEEGEAGFQVLSNEELNLDENGVTIFYTNSGVEELEVLNTSVISLQRAKLIVKEFFETKLIPKSVKWEEL